MWAKINGIFFFLILFIYFLAAAVAGHLWGLLAHWQSSAAVRFGMRPSPQSSESRIVEHNVYLSSLLCPSCPLYFPVLCGCATDSPCQPIGTNTATVTDLGLPIPLKDPVWKMWLFLMVWKHITNHVSRCFWWPTWAHILHVPAVITERVHATQRTEPLRETHWCNNRAAFWQVDLVVSKWVLYTN